MRSALYIFASPFSFGHCVVCLSSIYGFGLPLWYYQTLLNTLTKSSTYLSIESIATCAGPPREILHGETRLLWGHGDRLMFLSKLRIWGPIKPLVYFRKWFIYCDKHNQLMQQGVIRLSWFIVLNKLNIVENTKKIWKNQNKTSMTKTPFRDSQVPSWLAVPRTDVSAEPLLS